ncbi:hypothetical protein ACFO0M_02405 [Micromonospora mangrovi]|uniref:DUF2867 domain-containing protein n=2 Tax=Micromonospora TaxID=1873 RepID=A0AAU8HLM0_9ACTN
MSSASLPHVDEHATIVAAPPEDVWPHLCDTVERAFSRPGMSHYPRLVGSAEPSASGPRPLAEGSTLPGFRVVTALPGRELVLAGRHWFATYALIFRLEPAGPGRTRLRAETRAVFPGVAGGLYRMAVIGSGGHRIAVRRLLATVRRRAGGPPPARP